MITKEQFKMQLEWAMVAVVAFYMFVYGGAKFIQFGDISSYDQPLNSYKGMQLMWAFYAYSKTYAFIIGVFEILGAILLILPRTRIVGGLLLSSVLVNVILQDIFYGVNVGALIFAILFQIMILTIFYFHRSKISEALKHLKIEGNLLTPLNSLNTILLFIVLTIIITGLLYLITYLIGLILK